LILHCWSLRCAVCFQELPDINAIAERYIGQNVTIVSLMDNTTDELLSKIDVVGNYYKLKKPIFGNDKIDFEIIPNAKAVMIQLQNNDPHLIFPTTYVLKKGKLTGMSGYMVSPLTDGKTPEERLNYKHLVYLIESVRGNN